MTQPHYIRPNHVSRAPHCWIYLDTEAQQTQTPTGVVQRWEIGVTCHDHQGRKRGLWKEPEWAVHRTPLELWQWVDARVVKAGRTIVLAHNLGYDLRIADAFRILPHLGWTLDRLRADADQVSCRWRRGPQTILMVDTMAWWPVGLAQLGAELGIAKPPLPRANDPVEVWAQRCTTDVLILQAAWRRTLAFLWGEDCGTWQPTGAGQAWSAWRHKHYTHKVLAAEWPDVRPMERAACWAGRAEAWRHGRHTDGPFTEWDYASAYLSIMRECELPSRHMGRNWRPSLASIIAASKWHRVLCHVTVTTDVPVVPCQGTDGILWPVGTFQTVLWENELRLAVAEGARVTVHRADYYASEPVLAAFGEWLAGYVEAPRGSIDPVVQRLAKHWSRAVVGRFGVRYAAWHPLGDALDDGPRIDGFTDVDTGQHSAMLQVGGQAMILAELTEGENAAPAIMGWIMAECRVRLWDAMRAAGFDHILHVDTDGLLVDRTGDKRLGSARVPGLRRKGRYASVVVHGPRQLVLGRKLRASGIPRSSLRVSDRTWIGEVWPRLATSLRQGEPDNVAIRSRRFVLNGTDHRRAHLARHLTAPFTVGEVPESVTV